MAQHGVVKHLNVLEQAGLITSKKRGREKLHFFNPVPIRLLHDRWVSKYAKPWVAILVDLKNVLEEKDIEKVFEIYIKTSPERLWVAITDPPRKLGQTMTALWSEVFKREGTSRVTWEIEPIGEDSCLCAL